MQLKCVHLLVAGDKQVGKSAKIVRLTTGRFIHTYSQSTQDWLYKRQLQVDAPQCHQSPVTLEILELSWSQLDSVCELEPEVANRFQWAQAFVVMYSITSLESFIRAKSCLGVARKFQHTIQREGRNQAAPSIRAPILLLANKSDLSAQARQVSLEEGQRLAQGNECLFAEVSILEARVDQLDGLMLELIRRLEPDALGGQLASDWTCVDCGIETPLVRWQHKPAAATKATNLAATSVGHSSESIPRVKCAPVSSTQLIRFHSSAVVAATVAFCRPLLSKNPTAAPPESNPSSAQMAQVQTIGPPPLAASSCVSRLQPAAKQRATSLRTSFKKASMVIVGGTSLAFKHKQASKQGEPLQQSTSSLHSSGSSTLSLASTVSGAASSGQKAGGKSANWIRSRFSLRQEAPPEISQSQQAGSRRPLFKYKERLKTVAFEPNYGASEGGLSQVDQLNGGNRPEQMEAASRFTSGTSSTRPGKARDTFDEAPLRALNEFAARKISVDGNSLSSYTLNGRTSNSGRSSPSLSNSETAFYGSLLIINNQQNPVDQLPPTGARHQSQQPNRQQRPASGDCNCNGQCQLNRLESRSSSATFFIGPTNSSSNNNNHHHHHNPMMAGGHRTILNRLNQRKDSRSTLSRASTSGGSYGDDEDDDEEADDEVGPLGDEGGPCEWPAAASLWPERRSSVESTPAAKTGATRPAGCQLVASTVGLVHQPIVERLQQQPALNIGGMISEAHQVVKAGKMSFCRALIKSIASPNQKKTPVEGALTRNY